MAPGRREEIGWIQSFAVLHDSADARLGLSRVAEAALRSGQNATAEVVSRATVLRKVCAAEATALL